MVSPRLNTFHICSPMQDVDVYWRKLLEVCGASQVATRCRVVVPENVSRLPPNLSLCSKLLGSPRALRRVRMLCRGRQGYIVPGGRMGAEEVRVIM